MTSSEASVVCTPAFHLPSPLHSTLSHSLLPPPSPLPLTLIPSLSSFPSLSLPSLLSLSSLLTASYKLHKLPPAISSLFNVAAHSAKQLRQFKYSVHTLVVAMLSHRAFITKVKW